MDWESFLQDHGIDFVRHGSNVKKGNINIACPFCGDDPSHHMGISLEKEAWGCWRSVGHAGYKAHNLIRALLRCSFTQARLIAQQYSHSDPEGLDDAIRALSGRDSPVQRPRKALKLPADFRPIRSKGSTTRFWNYLERRGFTHIDDLVSEYNLRCCTTGQWQDRVIFPLYRDGKLVSWTARAMQKPVNAPRYMALSEEDGALVKTTDLLFNEDDVFDTGGEILFVVEGPFDALKIDFYGGTDVRATCTFGTQVNVEQCSIIKDLSRRFKRTFLLFDKGAVEQIFHTADKLEPFGIQVGTLPDYIEDDPGSMTPKQVRSFVKDYLR